MGKKQKKQATKAIKCFFCQSKKTPDFKESEILKKFISDWGKIIPRSRSGVCAKHQRQLARAIKRARFLGLVPFTTQV